MNEIIIPVVIYSIVLIFCLRLIKNINKRHFDFFDPGFLLLIFITLTFLPLSIVIILWIDIKDIFPVFHIADLALYNRTVIAHTIFIASFTAGYCFFARRILKTDHFSSHNIWYSKTWIHIGLFFIILQFLVGSLKPSGIILYPFTIVQWMKEASEIIAFGVITCQFNSKKRALIFLIILGVSYMFLTNIFFGSGRDDIIEINRGRTFSILLGALCYADMVKWKGELLNFRTFTMLVILGLAGLSIAGIFEGVTGGDALPSLATLGVDIALAFEPIIFENAATIISWVDDGHTRMEAGRTYLLALEGFKLFGHKYQSLSQWYVWKRSPAYAAAGGGLGFSAVAEGYLNGKFFGVFIHGLLLSILAAMVQRIKYSKLLGCYRPFFYAPAILLILALNRKEIKGFISTVELIFISVACLIIFYIIITEAACNNKKTMLQEKTFF